MNSSYHFLKKKLHVLIKYAIYYKTKKYKKNRLTIITDHIEFK